MILTLLTAAFLGGATMGVFITLVIGIRIEEHRAASTRAENAARHVMGVYVRKPADKVRR